MNKQLYILVLLIKEASLYSHRVEESMLNGNINMFSNYKKMRHPSSIHSDMLRILYMQFCSGSMQMDKLPNPQSAQEFLNSC